MYPIILQACLDLHFLCAWDSSDIELNVAGHIPSGGMSGTKQTTQCDSTLVWIVAFPQCSNWLTNEYSRTYYMCTTVNSYQLSYYVTAYCISVDIWMSIAAPTLLMQYSDHNLLLNITGQYQSHLTISRKAKVEEKRKKRNGDKLKSNIEQNSVTLSQLLSV